MAKKLKKKAAQKAETTSGAGIGDAANQIWLAGLGAFSRAQAEGAKVFDTLVSEGRKIEKKTRDAANAGVDALRTSVKSQVGEAKDKAEGTWDKLEGVFESRVSKALHSLGVPTADEIRDLTRQVEELRKAVAELDAAEDAAPAKPAARKTTAKKAASKKTVSKKATSKKTTSKKTTTK